MSRFSEFAGIVPYREEIVSWRQLSGQASNGYPIATLLNTKLAMAP